MGSETSGHIHELPRKWTFVNTVMIRGKIHARSVRRCKTCPYEAEKFTAL